MNIRQAKKINDAIWKEPRRSIAYWRHSGGLVFRAVPQLNHTSGQRRRAAKKLHKNSIRRWNKMIRWQTKMNRLIVLEDMVMRSLVRIEDSTTLVEEFKDTTDTKSLTRNDEMGRREPANQVRDIPDIQVQSPAMEPLTK